VYGGAAQAYGTTAAYLAWRPLWRAFFGLDGADPPATQAQTVAQAIQQLAPALAERLPLLGVVLGLDLPDTPLTAQFDARLRKSSLEALLVDCLRAQALASTPVLLVLEDCHWLDPLSQDLLEALSRAIPALPVLLLPASRPPDPGAPALLRRLAALAHYSDLPLGAIAAADAAALVQLHLGTLYPSIPAGVVDTLVARAAGNPFYLEELLAYLASRPRELQDPLSLAAMEWPASLQSVILARIDQLSESQRRTLKVASVIGRQFQAPQLWGAYPELGPVAVVQADLAVLDQVDLTPLDVPVPEPTYLFKHVLTQEVTYASIPHHLRTQLHAQLAAWLEAEDAGALDLLAYHYGRSSNPAKQREYYRKAAEAATAAYAHEVALGYYRQLVALVPLAEQPPLLLQMARITELVGQWAAAEALIQQALQIAEDAADVSQQAHCWHALGRLLGLKGSLDAAVAWLDKARTRFVALDDLPGLGPVLHTLGVLHVRQSQYAEAVACFERQVQIARQYQDRRLLARAWHGLANLYWQQGDWTLAEHYYQQTHAIYAELGDRLETSHALGNLGIIYKNQGQFARALACYAEDLRISTAIGAREGAGRTRGNIGNLYGQLGDFERAVGYSFQRLQITRDLGDPRGAMLAIGNIAEAYFWQGQHAAAGRLYPLAIALARALHIPHLLCALLTTSATVCLAGGYYRPAQAALAEALAVAGAIQRADILLEAHCLDIRARTALGQMAMIDAAATLAALAQAESEPARQAFVQYTHWQIDPTAAAARTAAATLYRRLHTERPEYPYAARYAELTGESLPALVLPDLPEYVLHPVPAPPDVVSYAEAVAHQVTPAGPERS
ncbi:MAG TPA: tetratricopeptide repeat protein, partial [Chloroflexia bacterium]|nr:tetratricopeptide repeat protein [Chloroflexia bacterium]